MADPLTQTVEEFAPAPLNLFDQKQAETIISRHSNSRRNLESAAKAFDVEQAASRVEQDRARMEQERIKAQRDALLATREDEIYAQKKEGETMRSQFIGDMFDALRPKEEGYDQRMVEFFKSVPQSVQNDEVFREVLKGYTSMAEKAEAERRQQREIETRGEQQRTTLQERTKLSSLYSNLKPEDWEKAPRDEAGEPSMEWLASKAADRKIERELELAKGKKDIQVEAQKNILDYKNMDEGQKALHDETEEIIINDTNAFPRRVDMVMSKYGEETELYTPDQVRELREARAWDKNLFKNEVLAAKASENMEDYVNAPGMESLPPLQKEYRRRVWEYANTFGGKLPAGQGGTGESEPAAPAPAPAPTAAAPAPAPALTAPTDEDLSKLIDQWKEKRAQARSDSDNTYEIELNDKEYVKIDEAADGSTYLVYRGGVKNRGTHRLDGPAWVERNAKGEIIAKGYAIEDEKMLEEEYWKDPRVIEYAKTKGAVAQPAPAAPAPAAPAPAAAPAAPAPAASQPAAPAPAVATPNITPDQILQKAPQGSQVFLGQDGFYRVRLPDGRIQRVVPK